MNNRKVFFAAVFFYSISLFHLVAQEQGKTSDLARKADHEALRTLKTKVVKAINTRDVKSLASSLADPFVFTAVDQTRLTSVKQIEDYYKKIFDGPDAYVSSMKCDISADVLTRFTDSNTGYCYGTAKETYKLKKNNMDVVMNTSWTAVVVKQNGEWKIAAVQSGVNFMDNPLIEFIKKSGRIYLFTGLISGFLLSMILFFTFRKFSTRRKTAPEQN